ncbi:P-loop containing nucleoside triphosphate hydrolase protein [Hysterangium stoloniferum]|nr:P-loop containing nucleoside triphosphate hydrolase protein [Hysterangium stoloniferum]
MPPRRRDVRANANAAVGGDFVGVVEVKMSSTLREQVEDAIKKTHTARSGYSATGQPLVLLPDDHQQTFNSLKDLGFNRRQILRTLKALSEPSPLTASLLASSSTSFDAAISHLLLCVPECDLPPQFLGRGAGESFVQAVYKGTEDLKTRWLMERAVKQAGYPEHIVRQAVSSMVTGVSPNWDTLLEDLGQRLIGEDKIQRFDTSDTSFDVEERDSCRQSEMAVLESLYPSMTVTEVDPETSGTSCITSINIPVPNTPLTFHIVLSNTHSYPLSKYSPPMYVSTDNSDSASKVPPYVRLHVLSTVLTSPLLKERDVGDGVGLISAGIIEAEWEIIQREGPPDVADVLNRLLQTRLDPGSSVARDTTSVPNLKKVTPRKGGHGVADDRTNAEIIRDLQKARESEKFQLLLQQRIKLPAWNAKEAFMKAYKTHRVVVCVGETGSGKTTQVPQYILDDYLTEAQTQSNDPKSLARMQIIVTQPRRVAAISVASRVSSERGEDGSVAYTIRGESTATRRTKLLFCTTGVVLRRLTVGDKLDGVKVIVVDEVHERSVDSDFLLLELREILKINYNIKVVLMSATINQKTFLDYFGGAALVTIPGRTFPVQDSYLEEIITHISYSPAPIKPVQKKTEEQLRAFRQIYEAQGLGPEKVRAIEYLVRGERIDYQLVAATVTYIVNNKGPGAILIFMPGVQEIKQCVDSLKASPAGKSAEIFPLHANLSSDEQRAVFRTTSKRKIVVSTNVAETSITIDDVVYVIDTGKVKETSYDPETGLSRLEETWVTQAAARQRRGRAGRTRPGECYKLYTKKQEQEMGEFPIPEILRVPLESLSLSVKAVRETEDVKLFLGKAIDPPPVAAMEKAWSVLQELGAVDQEDKLTALGRYMSLLPVDLRLGKMLILGSIFDCLDPILTVSACLSSKPLFVTPADKREESLRARARFSTGNGDLLTDVHAYDMASAQGKGQALRVFCEDNFISFTTVRDITSLREDLRSALLSAGISSHNKTLSTPPHPALLQSIIMAGLYPRIARVTLPSSAIKFDKIQGGTVQRAQEAKEFKIFDLESSGERDNGRQRVFLHPTSVLFGQDKWKEPFLCYFRKAVTSKPFLRDATEVPIYAVLLFGGPITVNHIAGGLAINAPGGSSRIHMKAWPRIGVLVKQLRKLLDEELAETLETSSLETFRTGNPLLEAILALLTKEEFAAQRI